MKKKGFISIIIIISILSCSFIQIFYPVTVCALSVGGLQSTIASIIISMMLQCGVAPVNNTWLNTLNTSYGASSSFGTIQDCIEAGLLTQSGSALVDTGLSSAIESSYAYSELGLSQIFSTTADDVANGVVAASGGVNITNSAINAATLGNIGAFAGAVGVGIGAGVLIDHLREAFTDFIRSGAKITYNKDVIANCPDNATCYYNAYGASGSATKYRIMYYYVPKNVCTVAGLNNQYQYSIYGITRENQGIGFPWYRFLGDNQETSGTAVVNNVASEIFSGSGVGNWGIPDTNMKQFSSVIEAKNFLNEYKEGIVEKPAIVSPDLIGKNGNMKEGEENFQNVVPEGWDMKPVDMNQYLDFADEANNNTDEGNISKPIQGESFDNLIDSLLVEPSIIPDQGVSVPDVPDRPIIPDQPTVPGKDPITGEQQSEVLEGITTPDLRSVFPFCIPFDLYNIFGVLKYEGREPPVIVWEANIMGNTYPVIIDLSPYEDVASILRLMELLLFIVGLAAATRSLIGAGG